MIQIKICFAYQMNANVKSESEKKRERGRERPRLDSLSANFSLDSFSLFVYMEMRSLLMVLSRLELIIE